jgi:exopolysaccharide production protein ExoZ
MKPGVIGNLQVLRGVAAIGVVFYHTAYLLAGGQHTDLRGVEMFFVISGFIMCYISQNDGTSFLLKRIVRIVPLYWLCTAFLLALSYRMVLRPWTWPVDFVPHVVESLFFLPSDRFPILGVGWTLNYEMYFYLLFAIALAIHRKAAPLIAAALVIGILSLAPLGCGHFLCTYYAQPYIKFFVFGIALYYFWSALAPKLPRIATAVIGTGLIALLYATELDPSLFGILSAPLPASAGIVMPVAVVAAALAMSASGTDLTSRPILLVGDASYAIYLTHTIAMIFVPRLVERGMPAPSANAAAMLAVVAACVAIGIAVHLAIEKPIGRRLRRLVRGETQPPLRLPAHEAAS